MEIETKNQTEAGVVADLAKKSAQHLRIKVIGARELGTEGVPLAVVPRGMELQSLRHHLDEWLDKPRRKTGTAELQTLESFTDHVNRHKSKDSAVFADRYGDEAKLLAVLDYHPKDGSPAFGSHRSLYKFPLSDEWEAWIGGENKGPMSQAAFAEFIEQRVLDLIDPKGATETVLEHCALLGLNIAKPMEMVTLSRGLSINEGRRVQQHFNLSSGEAKLAFAVEHQAEDGSTLRIPGAFLIAIPVFRSGDRFQVLVRLRYRVRDGNVTWSYELTRADDVFDTAFDEACEVVKERTELPLFVGKPE